MENVAWFAIGTFSLATLLWFAIILAVHQLTRLPADRYSRPVFVALLPVAAAILVWADGSPI